MLQHGNCLLQTRNTGFVVANFGNRMLLVPRIQTICQPAQILGMSINALDTRRRGRTRAFALGRQRRFGSFRPCRLRFLTGQIGIENLDVELA